MFECTWFHDLEKQLPPWKVPYNSKFLQPPKIRVTRIEVPCMQTGMGAVTRMGCPYLSTFLCKVDMEEAHNLRVMLKNLSMARNFQAIAYQQFFWRKWKRKPYSGQLVHVNNAGPDGQGKVGAGSGSIFVWPMLDGQIKSRTSNNVFIFNMGLRFEELF